jgi:hypothetical protein
MYLKCIKAFLDDRQQSVVINGICSPSIPVPSGVSQGSVLGPLLFLVYINDLPENIQSKVRLFADDTAIYLTLTSKNQSKVLQNDLCTLEKWSYDWDMEFNPSKCQVIHVTRSKTGIQLDSTSSARYLGVDITSDLTWDTHINRVTQKANCSLGFLRRNIKTHSEPLKATAYKMLVRPLLEYCSSVWSPYTDTLTNQIEAVQRRAGRWVKNDYGRLSSVSEMLESLHWR